jgi:hypothetical protein
MSKKVKIFAIVGLVLAAIVAGVSFLGSSSGSTTSTTPSDNGLSSSVQKAAGVPLPTTSAAPTEFSVLLSTISSITIDTSIFTDSAYRALRDYPITLGTDVKGRPNPFAPIGVDTGSITGVAPVVQVQFDTIQPGKVTATTAEFAAQAIVSTPETASVVFEYGTNDLLGSATAPVALGKNGTVLYRVTGLAPATTYYVRAVLAQGSITTPGNIMTFTTAAR